MSERPEKQVDVMGFDRFQIATIKRTFKNNKSSYEKIASNEAKIKKLQQENAELEATAMAWEAPIKELSRKVTGFEMTSKAILEYHENPELWEQQMKECFDDIQADPAIEEHKTDGNGEVPFM